MIGTFQKIVEQVKMLNQKERQELGRLLADSKMQKQAFPVDQVQLLARIRRRRSFCPADHDLPDSLLVLREDRGR